MAIIALFLGVIAAIVLSQGRRRQLALMCAKGVGMGLTAQDVFDLYKQKLAVNHARQDENYSMTAKDEADNKGIKLNR